MQTLATLPPNGNGHLALVNESDQGKQPKPLNAKQALDYLFNSLRREGYIVPPRDHSMGSAQTPADSVRPSEEALVRYMAALRVYENLGYGSYDPGFFRSARRKENGYNQLIEGAMKQQVALDLSMLAAAYGRNPELAAEKRRVLGVDESIPSTYPEQPRALAAKLLEKIEAAMDAKPGLNLPEGVRAKQHGRGGAAYVTAEAITEQAFSSVRRR